MLFFFICFSALSDDEERPKYLKSSSFLSTFPNSRQNNLFVEFPQRTSTTKRQTMVVPLGPGKFYGSSLPRPRIYTDTKFNSDRVDPPLPVLDPLLSWANEAHWSMGGLSFKRLRLQGRIEGNVKRLKAQREKLLKDSPDKTHIIKKSKRDASVSPPPAPVAVKRRRFLDLNNDDESENEEVEMVDEREEKRVLRKGAARKLGYDFERVANNSGVVSKRERSFSDGIGVDVMNIVEEVNVESEFEGDKKKKKKKKKKSIEEGLKNGKVEVQSGTRTSPRLAKRGSSSR
ncbi:uncharacterized protein LOC110416813 [Herrania umbratica]|uniref:Uncharacterized protein LOC110416813 n=1 Tax=Herrania umbratica TaxID=108875 RepID=A0A6J1AC87_9ROSI|nr:uncharacterized protein LOC110416813 [Herrania umbratica]